MICTSILIIIDKLPRAAEIEVDECPAPKQSYAPEYIKID